MSVNWQLKHLCRILPALIFTTLGAKKSTEYSLIAQRIMNTMAVCSGKDSALNCVQFLKDCFCQESRKPLLLKIFFLVHLPFFESMLLVV